MAAAALSKLKVASKNPFLLETQAGEPFFLLSDTAWELFHRLTFEEARHYFENRKRQGFNMFWVNILAEFDGLRIPNACGDLPLIDMDPTKPNPAYFDFVDKMIALAAEYGLYVGVLPTWGDKVTLAWGEGPVIFDKDHLDVARGYGQFVGSRLAKHTNILWVMGGDRPAKRIGSKDGKPDEDWTPVWRAMAEGIISGYGSDALLTYHPQGGPDSTSVFIHDEPWLHLNAMQSGHGGGRDLPVWEMIERDRAKNPQKPTFDAEPCYEDHPVSPWPTFNPQNGFFDEYDVRRQIYRSVFAGGCGVVYGHHSIWQFAADPAKWVNHAKMDWKQALVRPAAEQMGFMKQLLLDHDWLSFTPAQDLILSEIGAGPEHRRAGKTSKAILVYLPHGGSVKVNAAGLGESIEVKWFDPRTGLRHDADAHLDSGAVTAKCPNDVDWVLEISSK